MYATDVVPLSKARNWTRARLILEMRRAGRQHGMELPDDASLRRMIRLWSTGERGLSEMYAQLFSEIFGVPFQPGKPAHDPDQDHNQDDGDNEASDELAARLSLAATVDAELIALFEDQTESLRRIDRRLGAARLLVQTEAHVAQMSDLLTYSLPSRCRPALAAAVAEAAALAGWQALDLGDTRKAWMLHETAKAAARDSENPAILAHVTAQQAYVLLDLGRVREASELINYARAEAARRVPDLLLAWLWAAEAESLAAAKDEYRARAALDKAAQALPANPVDETLPFIFLDDVHLARWRGHCLARLGAAEAVDDLTNALTRLDPSFTRAAASLRCDLALAYSVRGQHEEARAEARQAQELADRTASARQRRRIRQLMMSGQKHAGD